MKLCEQLRIVEEILDLLLGIIRCLIKPRHWGFDDSVSGYGDY